MEVPSGLEPCFRMAQCSSDLGLVWDFSGSECLGMALDHGPRDLLDYHS